MPDTMKCPFYFSLVLLLCCNLMASARQESCKAKLKANREKVMHFDGILQPLEISFRTGENHEVTVWHKAGYDSVQLLPASGPPAMFIIFPYGIVRSPFVRYMSKGVLLTDSIRPDRSGAHHQYFGLYTSYNVAATFNAAENSLLYYSGRGKDSFFTVHYPQGNRKAIWYDSEGTDTATRQWSSAGVLNYYRNKDGIRTYFPQAVLETHTYDTLITGLWVSCRRTYYPDGTLRVVSYYLGSVPCGTWLFYDRKGKLSGRKKYPAASTLPRTPMVGSVAEETEVFATVAEEAAYPGGPHAFQAYVNGQLPALLCQSTTTLSGSYAIRLQIDNTGKTNMLGVSGSNADQALAGALERMLRGSGPWKPAKRNGRAADVTFLMTITVQ